LRQEGRPFTYLESPPGRGVTHAPRRLSDNALFRRQALRHDDTLPTAAFESGPHKFQVNVDLQEFEPEEISVKTMGHYVVIEGNHEQQESEHNCSNRNFVCRYYLPENAMSKDIKYHLGSDGILKIEVDRFGE